MDEAPIRGSVLLLARRAEALAGYVRAAEKLGVDAVLGVDESADEAAALRLRFGQRESALEIVQYAMHHPLAAIVPGDAQAAPSAMRAASMLGMRCHAPKGADACLDKFSLRQKLSNAGLRTPLLGEAPAGEDVGVAAIIDSGKMRVLGILQERGSAPSGRVGDPPPHLCFEAVVRAARVVGLNHGPVSAEVRAVGSEVWVLDLGAVIPRRLSERLRFRIPLVDEDVSLEEVVLRHALGLDIRRIYRAQE